MSKNEQDPRDSLDARPTVTPGEDISEEATLDVRPFEFDIDVEEPRAVPVPISSPPKPGLSGGIPPGGMRELLELIATSGYTGTLHLVADDGLRTLSFFAGEIVSADSMRVEHELGEVLLRRGRVRIADLAVHTGEELGMALVRRGRLTLSELAAARQEQLAMVVQEIVTLTNGSWCFELHDRHSEKQLVAARPSSLQLLLTIPPKAGQ